MLTNKKRPTIRKPILIGLVTVIVLAGAGLGYTFWKQSAQNTISAEKADYHTAQVRRGDLTLSATGSGTLAAGKTANLSFPISGKVETLNVQVGDRVTKGQELAKLQDLSSLQASAKSAELDLKIAKTALEDLKNNKGSALANAQIALANTKKALDDAKAGKITAGMERCDHATTTAYYDVYTRAKDNLDALGDGGGSQDYYLNVILPAKNKAVQAYTTYPYCAGFTDYEIESSQANLTLAEANVKEAQETLKILQENGGLDPDSLAEAENKVANAQAAYDKARSNLDNATLVAPFDGTVALVAGLAGDEVDTNTFISIVDLVHPRIEFSVDETDMDQVVAGNPAQVIFDAFPDDVFTGEVTQVNPALTEVSGYQVLQGIVEMDLSNVSTSHRFLSGLNATVEIIGGEAKGALLVPVEAVHNLGGNQYAVFVISQGGKPRLQVVEAGLMDATTVEIKSGLAMGDVVTTGAVETN
ncbi:MAG: efflux RND transporter periplasmic adaptor subunit [Anaerolineaceae bacterium]|nr:efflux RND transporter periplasmic adaptor subunit [Anaerolineaceae bacterium]